MPGLRVRGDPAGVVVAHHDDEPRSHDREQDQQSRPPRPPPLGVVLADRPERSLNVAYVGFIEHGKVGLALQLRLIDCSPPRVACSASTHGARASRSLGQGGSSLPGWSTSGEPQVPGPGHSPRSHEDAAVLPISVARGRMSITVDRTSGFSFPAHGHSSGEAVPKSRRHPVGSRSSSTSSTVTTPSILS